MIYQDFKDFLITHLWKVGDTIVVENLDTLITMAEAQLNRDLKITRREVLVDFIVTDNVVAFPDDLRQLRSISNPLLGEMVYLTPPQFANRAAYYRSAAVDKHYSTSGRYLRLLGRIDADYPFDTLLQYQTNIPRFGDTGESWLADEYLDLYAYAVLRHTAPFLREDERLPVWADLFNSAMVSAIDEDADRKYAGAPLKLSYPKGIR